MSDEMILDRKMKALEWSEASPPNDKCRYDHTSAATSIGCYQIEWKSWKQYDSYCLYFREDFIDAPPTLEDAKKLAEQHLKLTVMDLFNE